ncbi:MAG: hypothetical protein NUV73_02835 [Candidatus Daviesbacteria bacterium]|nr:hypothetical protein [Candidatus Daviesbacteria bacterium]
MTDTQGNVKKGINPVVAGIAGAAVGAGVAAAATTLLSNKKTRDAVFHTVDMARERVAHTLQAARKGTKRMRRTVDKASSTARKMGI